VSGIEDKIRQAHTALFNPSDVVEIRAFQGKKTVSGYFDNGGDFVEAACWLNQNGYQVYATLNEVNPALLARAANRLEEWPRSTTSDRDVVRRRWLPLDFDPVRPSGVSSSDNEHKAAQERATEVKEYLTGRGWPEPIVGDSGNGHHLLYRIDLPNDDASTALVKDILETLAFRFDDEEVKLDTGVHNAARIWKVYGTTARKGDSVPSRPHRVSTLINVPTEVVYGSSR
jgi:hypothetical protein